MPLVESLVMVSGGSKRTRSLNADWLRRTVADCTNALISSLCLIFGVGCSVSWGVFLPPGFLTGKIEFQLLNSTEAAPTRDDKMG